MDLTVLFKLTYGLYVVGAFHGTRPVGCTINTCFQVTSENPTVAISLNKQNYTLEAIRKHNRFSLSIIAEESDTMVIGKFGFFSSRDTPQGVSLGIKTFLLALTIFFSQKNGDEEGGSRELERG